MVVRTTPIGGAIPGGQGASSQLNGAGGGWIGHAQVTANQTGPFTTQTDLTGLTVAVTVGSNRRIKVSGYVIFTSTVAAAQTINCYIMEGATQLANDPESQAGSGYSSTATPAVILTPSTGVHTYKLAAGSNGGHNLVASATSPAFILVEDLGPA